MTTHPVNSFLPLELKKGDRKIQRRSVLLLNEGYALGQYGDILVVSQLTSSTPKHILVENFHRIKQLQISFPYVVSLHVQTSGSAKNESLQVWNVQTSLRSTCDLWKKDTKRSTQLILAGENSIAIVSGQNLYRIKIELTPSSRPQFVTALSDTLNNPTANLSHLYNSLVLLASNDHLEVRDLKSGELILSGASRDKAPFLLTGIQYSTVVAATADNIYVWTLGQPESLVIPQAATPSTLLLHKGTLFVGDFKGQITIYDLDRGVKLYCVNKAAESAESSESTSLLDALDLKINSLNVQGDLLIALSHSGKLQMWHTDHREQTVPVLSLDNVGGSGGMITSCKTTDKMVYAYWEGEKNSEDKFLIWNASFKEIYEATRTKTSSNVSRRVLTLSGTAVLMTDLHRMKQVKRFFELSENVLMEYKSSRDTISIGSYLLTSQSSVSLLPKKIKDRAFICVSLNKNSQIFVSPSSPTEQTKWMTAFAAAIEATKVQFFWRVNYDDLIFAKEESGLRVMLGQGSMTFVFKATLHGQPVAVKEYSTEHTILKKFETEVTMLSAMKHQNIIKLIGACVRSPENPSSQFATIQPYLELGSLKDLLHSRQNPPKFTWRFVLQALYEIADAINYIHTFTLDGVLTPIIHRDLKPANVLVASLDPSVNNPCVLLSDLSMSRYDNMLQTSTVGAVSYLAPEVMGGMGYTTSSDVFSFAVCAWEIITGLVPYEKESVMKVHQLVMTGKRLPIPEYVPPSVAEFISACWREKPEGRPSFAQIMSRLSEMILECLVDGTIDDVVQSPPPSTKGKQNRKLYGSMEAVVSAVNSTKQWKNGNLEILAIHGPSGIGKTAFMKRIANFAAVQKYVGYGKWHGRGGLRPYHAIAEAIEGCIETIRTSWSAQKLEHLRTSLLFALGETGLSVLEGIIPQLPKIVKYDAGVKGKLRRKEADSNHVQWLLLQFIRQLANEEHPLLLALDNAHWADVPSLQLLRQISKIPHLLLICNYVPETAAPNASTPTIETVLKQLRKSGTPVTEISLNPLSMENIVDLLADFFEGSEISRKSGDRARVDRQELASKLLKNTGGNPFDLWHILLTQNVFGIFSPDEKGKSEDGKDKETSGGSDGKDKISENFKLNLLAPLQSLSSTTAQRLVFLASCLNCNFGVDTLLILRNKIAGEQSKALSPRRANDSSAVKKIIEMCVDNFIFTRIGDSELYTWTNDKIRDSIYHQFGVTVALADVHLELAEALGEALVGPKPPAGIDTFEVAQHYLKSTLPSASSDRIRAAKTVLRVALDCVSNLKALETAHVYCVRAVELLGLTYNTQLDAVVWESEHQLCWDTYITLLDCEKARGDDKVAAKIIQQLGRQSSSKAETSKVFLEMIKNIEMKMRREEAITLVLDYLHFHGLRKEITSAQSVFENPAIIDKLRSDVHGICHNDISSILISDEVEEQPGHVEDLHGVLLIGLEAAASMPLRHMARWMLYELVLLYAQNNKLRRHLKPCLMLALELEEKGDRRQAERILHWCKPFVIDLGSLPELQQVPTLEVVANAYWSEFPASYMIEHYINPAINIGIRQNSLHHVGYHFSNRFILHFAMGNWSVDNIAQTFQHPLARKLMTLSSKYLLLFDIYGNGIRFLKSKNPRYWIKGQEILKDITPTTDQRYWIQSFFFWFADVVYDSGIEMTQFFFNKGLCSAPGSWLSGTYLAPFVWWCSSMQLFRYVLRTTFLDPNREEFLERARNGIPILQFFERGGGNLAPHLSLLEVLALRVLFSEQQQGLQAHSAKKEKQISQIIFKFNKTLTVAREAGNAWLYAITCESAAEFYEQMLLKPLAKAHLEEAVHTYAALDAMAKVKQLETIMSHTAGLLPSSPTSSAVPAWPFLSRLTRALLSYPPEAQTSMREHLRSLQSYFDTLSQSYSTSLASPSDADPDGDEISDRGTAPENSENSNSEFRGKTAGTGNKSSSVVTTNFFVEDLCQLVARVFEERKVQIVPMINPSALDHIRGNVSKLGAVLLFLLMGYIDSLEDPVPPPSPSPSPSDEGVTVFVFVNAVKQHTGTGFMVYVQDYFPLVLPWDSEEKEEPSDPPSELQTALAAVSPLTQEFSLSPFYSTPNEHSKLVLKFSLPTPKILVGVVMDPSSFVHGLTTKYLASAKIEFSVIPKPELALGAEKIILPRPFLDKTEVILVDDTTGALLNLVQLQEEERKKIIVVTRQAAPSRYNDHVLLSHLSKLSTIL